MGSEDSYDVQVVKEFKRGVLMYPRNIPGDRGCTALVLQILISIALAAACTFWVLRTHNLIHSFKYLYYSIITNVLAIILCSILWRICNLFEELQHTHARYDDSISKVFKFIFHFNNVTIVFTVLAIASLIGMAIDVGNPLKYLWSYGPEPYLFSLLTALLITRLIDADESKLDTVLNYWKLKGLNYGSHMAYSFFYGYLNIVLPSSGGDSQGLLDNIKLYESTEQVKIPAKKLFILIPTSLRTPPNLDEGTGGWMESVQKLNNVIKTRAGVIRRTYHNTVYKIWPEGPTAKEKGPVYVVAEGATPLLTFYEAIEHSSQDSTHFDEYKKEIVGSFYRALRHIIKSKQEVRDLCELVFYEDFDPENNRVNVAKILLDRIKELVSLE